MPVTALNGYVIATVLPVAAKHGFVLAGGNALITHGVIDRPTDDVDLFTDDEGGVEKAARAVEKALAAAGLQAEWVDKTGGLGDLFPGMGEGLAEWVITAPGGERTVLQLAYFHRRRKPVKMGGIPVLDLNDVLAQKVVALASRIQPRDYVDVAAALECYSPDLLIDLAKRQDPGLTDADFADAGRRVDDIEDWEFAGYGLSPSQIATLRERFAGWPR